MIKKIFAGVLLAAVFGLLVFGAVNRTLAKSDEKEPLALSEERLDGYRGGNENSSNNQNRETGEITDDCDGDCEKEASIEARGSQGNNRDSQPPADGTGYRNGLGESNSTSSNPGQQGQSNDARGDGLGSGQADVTAWITVTGIMESATPDLWVITLSDGSILELEGRVLRYMIDQNFSATAGDNVTVTGFFEGDMFEIGQIENTTTGFNLTVREENGRPLWAGGSQGGRNN